jgi:type IV pilus assembly protein PilY1
MNTKDYYRLFKRSFGVFSIGALIALQGITSVEAMDTDVYLMSPSVARDDAPNVMIILDNSGSMDTIITSTRPAYNPSINYCTGDLDSLLSISGANAGKPSNCTSFSNYTYWSFSSTPPDPNNTTNFFTSTDNKCLASVTPLSSAGIYGSAKIARWDNSSNKASRNGWKTLSGKTDSNITYVDCDGDGMTNGLAASDSKFPDTTTGSAYTTNTANAFNWASFTSNAAPTLYSANYINYVNNTGLVVSKSRIQVAKDAVNAIIDGNPSVRFGLTVFNNNSPSPDGGRVLFRVDTMDAARRTAMHNVVNSLTASTYTPLAETMWEVYRYYAGLGVTYGNPSPVQTPHQDSCAQNVANSACNNGGIYDAIAAGNSAYNTGTYISPFKYGCQTGYIILVTDGDPTNDTSADTSIKTRTGKSACSTITAGGSSVTSCLSDLTEWMHKNDVYSGLPGNQVVNTYTVGFGGGISATGLALLQATAQNGGGKYYNADNADQLNSALQGTLTEILSISSSFVAPSLSINAFNKLYDRDDVYFALFMPSSSVAWDGNVKRFRLCNSTDVTSYGCAYGAIIDALNQSAIDSTTSRIKDTAVSYWSLDTTIPDGSNVSKGGAGALITQNSVVPRTLYTYRGSYTGLSATAPATPTTVVATAGNTLYDTAINDPTILGLPDTSGSNTTTNATDTAAVTSLISWMRGQDAYDQNIDIPSVTPAVHSGNLTETRPWNFSDPLHSRPVAITYGAVTNILGVADKTNPIVKLFVGNNDGTIRMINGSTGAEEWAFVPQEMLNQQFPLSQDADGGHIYGVDDTPSFWINDINGDGIIDPAAGDFVYMYIGMRRGGRNIYAFDVTPSSKMTSQSATVTPKLMWVINGGSGNFVNLGQTWSRPKVTRIRYNCTGTVCNDDGSTHSNSKMVLIFGGGYDTNQDNAIPAGPDSMGNAIYIVDPKTGQRIWWTSSDATASLPLSGMLYSIPSELTLLDSNGDKYTDRIYVGDTGGQIWRIDLGTQLSTTSNGGSNGYLFADVGCDSTSSTRRFHNSSGNCPGTSPNVATNQGRRKIFYPPDVSQVNDPSFSTTAYYDLVTIATGNREDPLDLLTTNLSPVQEAVHNRIYAFRDYNYAPGIPVSIPASGITDTDMYDASANNLGTLTGASLTIEINTLKATKGWFIDLKEAANVTLTNGLSTIWVGEKSLAKTTIYAGTLYVTTFVPANSSTALNTCQANEGEGRYYAINYLTGTAMFDLQNTGVSGATQRSAVVGGGIPSEVVVVIRDDGVTGLVGVSGGATQTKVKPKVTIMKSYWYEE